MNQKRSILIAAAMFVATFVASPNANATDYAPGEGGYLGAFAGFGTGILQAKVETLDNANFSSVGEANTIELKRGGIGLSGFQGGGYAGWGMKTADDIYLGFEMGIAGSDEKFEITSSKGVKTIAAGTGGTGDVTFTKISAKRNWVAGGAARVGYYVNPETLFALKGGIAVSQFDVEIGSDTETYYAGGPQVGASVESRLSKIDPNLSLRMEFVYTDYLTADILGAPGQGQSTAGHGGTDNTLTGHDAAGRIGIQYSFWDFGSLF
jgi:hypothetical protein